ncbi:MAG: chemotaxis protein CheA, partial [Pseudomonadota bacterium]
MAARGEGTGASTAADIRAGFFLECEDLLAESTDALDALKAPGATLAALDALFRAVHSIKGGAAAFGLSDLTDFAHGMETQLATYRAAGALPTPGAVAGLERLADRLARLVALARAGTALSEEERLADAALLSHSEARDAQRAVQLTLPPSATDGKSTLRALETLGRVDAKPDPGTLPDLASFDPAQPKLGFQITLWTELSPALVQTALQDLDPEGCLKAQQDEGARAPAPAPPSAPTIRVDLGRIDKLINLVGELVINQAMLARSAETLGARPNSDHMLGLEELMRLTRDLQSNVMQIRAQPIKPLFQRMARICREAAAAAGKRVTLAMEGSETEIDKTVLERLADPLTHMIRNAVDHAIEPEEARRAAGKPAEGQITLSASHRSGQVILQVSDDGAGIDRAKVRARAEAAGLIAPGAALSTADIDELLFAPGLSTAAGVSALSGRGVGMDVVRAAILSLGGRISIESRPGAGTRFEIALPLTL